MRLIEFVKNDSPTLRVDRERGIIEGVKVLGHVSANSRTYTQRCLDESAHLWEGLPVSVDHPQRGGDTRSATSRLGWLKNLRSVKDKGIFADLHYLKSHAMAGPLAEAAERNPRLMGLSIEAEGDEEMRDGKKYIEKITRAHGAAVVAEPAACPNGLSESRTTLTEPRTAPAVTLSEAMLRWAGRCDAPTLAKAKREWLAETPSVRSQPLYEQARKTWVQR